MHRVTLILLGLLLIATPTVGRAAPSRPADVLVATDRTEPVVAVDPAHPSIVVAGANTNYDAPVNGTFPTAWFASANGGRSFSHNNVPLRAPYTTAADPTVAIARDGTVFYSYLGETPAYCSGGRSAVMLAHSIDHGRSFRGPVEVDSNPADDKPSMAVEGRPQGASHIFLTWTRWYSHSSEVWLGRSVDGGASFAPPIRLRASGLGNFGSVPLVAPHHRIYVFWSAFPDNNENRVARTEILMRASTDDGRDFGPARDISGPFPALPGMTQPGSLRNLTMPTAAVGKNGGVYVAYARVSAQHKDGSDNANIVLIRSTNGGTTWSKRVNVNDVTRGDRFMPAMAAFPDGSIGLAFYDRRSSRANLDVYAARVTDDGTLHVSPNVRLNSSDAPIADIYYIKPGSTCFAPGRFFGDYIGVAPGSGHSLCAVWSDTQRRVPNQTDIWFTRRALPTALSRRLGSSGAGLAPSGGGIAERE
jgi:hypothetical protein